MKALFLTILVLYSCTDHALLKQDSSGPRLENVKMDITHLKEIDWWIGAKRDSKVTQSVTFILELPKVSESDLKELKKNKDIDAWIVRLIVERPNEKLDLGSLYVPLNRESKGRVSSETTTPTNATLKIYYAAAYASERFRNMKCPPFGHSFRVTRMNVEGEDKTFEIFFNKTVPYGEKSQRVELSASSFNAGHSFIGTYYLEIAPYDSKNKIIRSDFKRIPKYVSISGEEKILVKSCEGIHQEFQH